MKISHNNFICPNCDKTHKNKGLLSIHIKHCDRKIKIHNTVIVPSNIFQENKYTKWYYQIINNSKLKEKVGYYEDHHVLPVSLGGKNDKENIVSLTAREHFICHYLLTKMTLENTPYFHKLIHAFTFMRGANNSQYRYFNSTLYNRAKEKLSAHMKEKSTGEKNIWYGHIWIKNHIMKKCIRIKKLELDYYIEKNEGWEKGRCINFDTVAQHKQKSPKIVKIKNIPKKVVKNKVKRAPKKKKYRDETLLPLRKTASIRYAKIILKTDKDITWNDYLKVQKILLDDLKTISYVCVNNKYSLGLPFPNKQLTSAFNLKNISRPPGG